MKKNIFCMAVLMFFVCHFQVFAVAPQSSAVHIENNSYGYSASVQNSSVSKNIVYKEANGKNLTLDVYKPLKKIYSKSPAVIFIHGGAWVLGSKDGMDTKYLMPYFDNLRQNGYTVFSINYRLLSEGVSPQIPVSDCKDAIRWVFKNSDQYSIDTSNIGLWGTSSGAHMAMLCAYSPDSRFKDDKSLYSQPTSIRYVIDFFGPTSFDEYMKELPLFLQKYYSSYPLGANFVSLASPLSYINATSPPTLIVQGEKDTIVSPSQSEKLYHTAVEKGASAKLIMVKGASHTLSGASESDLSSLADSVFNFIYGNYNTKY